MKLESFGEKFESSPFTIAGTAMGASHSFDLSFLNRAYANMVAPVVEKIVLRFKGEHAAAGGAVAAIDYPKLYALVNVHDKQGGIIDRVPGAVLAQIAQLENPGRQQAGVATNSGSTATITEWTLPIYFSKPQRGLRKHDTALELHRLVDGGSIRITTGTPVNMTFAAGAQFFIEATVRDEGLPEAKSRFRWSMQNIASAEASNYLIGGSLWAAFVTSIIATTGYTSLATGLATLNSKNFGFVDRTLRQFLEDYRQEASFLDTTLDDFLNSRAQAIVLASHKQKIGQLPDIAHLHLKMVSVPTSSELCTGVYEDREPGMTARSFGYTNVGQFAADVEKYGIVVSGSGKAAKSVTAWDIGLVKRLPMRLKHPRFERA